MRKIIFKTLDNTELVCNVWDNVKNPVGVIQFILAPNEQIQRYNIFARFLNDNGYIVFGANHHNQYISIHYPDDVFMTIASNEIQIMKMLKEKYNKPLFLIGNAYGTFITEHIIQETNLCSGLVCLSDTKNYPRILLETLRIANWICIKVYGPNTPARWPQAKFPTYNIFPYIAPIKCIKSDKKTSAHFSYAFYYSLFKNLIRLSYKINRNLPALVIRGGCDKISNKNSVLSDTLYNVYHRHNPTKTTIIIYPDIKYNELIGLNYMDIQHDILNFFNSIKSRY